MNKRLKQRLHKNRYDNFKNNFSKNSKWLFEKFLK